jgi:hypothetical protein
MISERLKIVSLGNSIQQSVISSQPNPLFNRKGREGRRGRRKKEKAKEEGEGRKLYSSAFPLRSLRPLR